MQVKVNFVTSKLVKLYDCRGSVALLRFGNFSDEEFPSGESDEEFPFSLFFFAWIGDAVTIFSKKKVFVVDDENIFPARDLIVMFSEKSSHKRSFQSRFCFL